MGDDLGTVQITDLADVPKEKWEPLWKRWDEKGWPARTGPMPSERRSTYWLHRPNNIGCAAQIAVSVRGRLGEEVQHDRASDDHAHTSESRRITFLALEDPGD